MHCIDSTVLPCHLSSDCEKAVGVRGCGCSVYFQVCVCLTMNAHFSMCSSEHEVLSFERPVQCSYRDVHLVAMLWWHACGALQQALPLLPWWPLPVPTCSQSSANELYYSETTMPCMCA